MKSRILLVLPTLFCLILPSAAWCRTATGYASGPKKGKKSDRSWTVLTITYYDGKSVHEILETKQLSLRAKEIWAEFPIWKAAHNAAKRQWHQWYSGSKAVEDRGRNWVLSKPRQPHMQQAGNFSDEIAAADKKRQLENAIMKRRQELAKGLYRNRRSSWPKMMYLNNLEANGRLVREMMTQVKDQIIQRERQFAQRMSDKKKRELWDAIHQAEEGARKIAVEKSKDKEGNPVKPDELAVYNISRKMIEPILAKYKVNEWQWYAIWEVGFLNKWPVPGKTEKEKVAER